MVPDVDTGLYAFLHRYRSFLFFLGVSESDLGVRIHVPRTCTQYMLYIS